MPRHHLDPAARRRALAATLLLGMAAPLPALAVQPDPTLITLGPEVAIEGEGATATAGHVRITAGGVYEFNGELTDGQIEVDAPDAEVEVILNDAQLTSRDGPAILVRDARTATLSLAPGSKNRVEDGGDTEFDAAIAAAVSLTIGGEGALDVVGNQNEGIASSMHLTFTGGEIHIRAVEDGVNANHDDVSEITITGGTLFVETETGDGIDSNGTITITGGSVTTLGAMNDRNGGLDADGDVTIDGGEVIAAGARQAEPAAASQQASLLLRFAEEQAAETLVVVRDSAGEDVLVFAPAIPFQQMLVSEPGIVPGATYAYFTGGTAEGEAVNGRSPAASDPGAPVGVVTASESGLWGRERGWANGGGQVRIHTLVLHEIYR